MDLEEICVGGIQNYIKGCGENLITAIKSIT
jgi:hypothetical protein